MSIRKRCASDTAGHQVIFFSSRGETGVEREKRDRRGPTSGYLSESVPHGTHSREERNGEAFPQRLELTRQETCRRKRRGRGRRYELSYSTPRFDSTLLRPRPRHPAGCPQLVGSPAPAARAPATPRCRSQRRHAGRVPRTHDSNRRGRSRGASISCRGSPGSSPSARHHHSEALQHVVVTPLQPVREVRERASVDQVRLGRAQVAPRLRERLNARSCARTRTAPGTPPRAPRPPPRRLPPSGTAGTRTEGSSSSTRVRHPSGRGCRLRRCSTHAPASNQGARAVAAARTRRRRTTR